MTTEAKFAVWQPDGIIMSMTLKMPLGRWKEVRAALGKSGMPTHYGSLGEVCQVIDSMVRQAGEVWSPEDPS